MGLDRKSYFTLIQHILQTASRNCVAEAKIPFCRIIGRREKDHEVLYPGLISLPTCGHCLRADGFEQSSRSEAQDRRIDRKSTRLNSSHTVISYAVCCWK